MLVAPAETAVKLPLVPILDSILSVTLIDSVSPLKRMSEADGVTGRRGSAMFVDGEAACPLTALKRTLSVTSLRDVAEGIMFSTLIVVPGTFVHLVPFVLNSI